MVYVFAILLVALALAILATKATVNFLAWLITEVKKKIELQKKETVSEEAGPC